MWTATPDPLWKHAHDPEFYTKLRQTAKRVYEDTDLAITMNYGSLVFELSQWVFRNDEFFIRLISERKQIDTLLDTLVAYHLERLEPLLEVVSPYASETFGMLFSRAPI